MAKRPAYMWYPGDWKKDPAVGSLTPEARAFWREAIDVLFESPTGYSYTATLEGWASLTRLPGAWCETFLSENCTSKVASVTRRNGRVTLMSRRMEREKKEREDAANRQRRHRARHDVTEASRKSHDALSVSSSVSSSKKEKRNAPAGAGYSPDFETWWEAWPEKRDKNKAFRCFEKIIKGYSLDQLLTAAQNYVDDCKANKRYLKLAATFLGPDRPFEEYLDGFPQASIEPDKCCLTCGKWNGRKGELYYCIKRSESTAWDQTCSKWTE